MVEIVIAGVIAGLLYAMSGAALVVPYRASRVLNFALGGIGTLGAYSAASAMGYGAPWVVGLLVSVGVGSLAGALSEQVVARPLARHHSPLIAAFGLLGALLALQGLIEWHWGAMQRPIPNAMGGRYRLGLGVVLTGNDIVTVVVAVVSLGAFLFLMFRTRLGLQMRATSGGPVTATTLGINVGKTSLVGWAIGGALAGAAAMLVALPAGLLTPDGYTGFLFLALVAIVLGGLTSIWGVLLGGIAFGIILNVLEAYLSTQLTYSFAYLVLTAALLVKPNGILGRPERTIPEPSLPRGSSRGRVHGLLRGSRSSARVKAVSWRLPSGLIPRSMASLVSGPRLQKLSYVSMAAALLVMVAMWWLAPDVVRFSLPMVVSTFVAVLGLDVLIGYCGQFSLAQGAFVGVGAYTSAIVVTHLSVPSLVTLPMGAVVGAVAGGILGIPAMRLTGLFLAQTTLIFAFVVPELVQRFSSVTGGANGLPLLTRAVPKGLDGYLVYLAIASACVVVTRALVQGGPGRRWRAVRDREFAARSLGQRTSVTKLGVFAFGCGLAGLAGAMNVVAASAVSPDSYSVWESIYLQTALIVGGMMSVIGNLLGAAFIVILPLYSSRASVPPDLIYGVVLIIVLRMAPRGLAGMAGTVARRIAALPTPLRSENVFPPVTSGGEAGVQIMPQPAPEREGGERTPSDERGHRGRAPAAGAAPRVAPPGSSSLLLDVRRVCAGYAGGVTINEVNLSVAAGEIVGVVGANGAGKSTLLRLISGLMPIYSGSIALQGIPINGEPAHTVGRLGVAHVMEGRGIFPGLTVAENLRLGKMCRRYGAGGVDSNDPLSLDGHDAWVTELFPILTERRQQRAGTLSGGQQQMLAIARSLLTQPRLLMLDEPSLGLAPVVSDAVFTALQQIRERGVAVLVVEQNVHEIFRVCDRMYVLADGRISWEGTPDAAHGTADDGFMGTYLGLTNEVRTENAV